MIRILMIAYSTYVRDARVKRHARSLAERGDEVDVLCLKNPEEGRHDGVNVIGIKLAKYRGSSRSSYVRAYIRFLAVASWTALRLGFKRRYDVVIVCTMPDTIVLCALPLRLFGSKLVLDVRDTMPELYREKFGGWGGTFAARLLSLQEQSSTLFVHRVLAVHELHRMRLEQIGVKRDKIAVILNVPDQRIFRVKSPTPICSDNFTIVCHGTIAERLGLDVAIRAMSLLQKRVTVARLLVIGQGDYLEDYRKLVGQLELQQSVQFLAPVPLEQLPDLLGQACIGLVPNRAGAATHLMLPVKLLEYAALGIPIIAARLNTISHYFDDSAIRFFEPGDASDLANAIEELYWHPNLRKFLSANARAKMKPLAWEYQRLQYFDAIDSTLKSSHVTSNEESANNSTSPNATNDYTNQENSDSFEGLLRDD